MTKRGILLLIAAFVTLTLGSFIWFVATWDGREASGQPAFIISPKILPPEAPAFQERAIA